MFCLEEGEELGFGRSVWRLSIDESAGFCQIDKGGGTFADEWKEIYYWGSG